MICSSRVSAAYSRSCSHSFRCGTVVLRFTGELFTVAPLILAIVSALLMTDSATMEIKMETLCQCDMHADWKVMGPEVRNKKKVIKSRVIQNWILKVWGLIAYCLNIMKRHLNSIPFMYRSQNMFPLLNFNKCEHMSTFIHWVMTVINQSTDVWIVPVICSVQSLGYLHGSIT